MFYENNNIVMKTPRFENDLSCTVQTAKLYLTG